MNILISILIFLNSFFSIDVSTNVSSQFGYSVGTVESGNYYQHSIFGSYENYYFGLSFQKSFGKEFQEVYNPNNYGNELMDTIVYWNGFHIGYIPCYIDFRNFYIKPVVAFGLGIKYEDYFYRDFKGIIYDKYRNYMLESDEKTKLEYNIKIGSSLNYKFLGLHAEYNLNKNSEFGFVINFNSDFQEFVLNFLGKDSFSD